jgi:hypothetical protein
MVLDLRFHWRGYCRSSSDKELAFSFRVERARALARISQLAPPARRGLFDPEFARIRIIALAIALSAFIGMNLQVKVDFSGMVDPAFLDAEVERRRRASL